MKRRLKEPFGKAGLTVGVIALVMALVGGAYAAGGLTKSQEKQVKKIAKKFAGKPGATGPAGPAGTNGTNGKDGAAGKAGTNGASVTSTAFTGEEEAQRGEPCQERGGVEFKSSSPAAFACNGEEGPEGSPWTAGGSLPKGSTETGTWGFVRSPGSFRCFEKPGAGEWETSNCHEPAQVAGTGNFEKERIVQEATEVWAPVSFPLPLAAPLPAAAVHMIKSNGEELLYNETPCTEPNVPLHCEEVELKPQSTCTGTAAAPTALPGNLCVYLTSPLIPSIDYRGMLPPTFVPPGGAGTTGTLLKFVVQESSQQIGFGTWAVTAP
jgi:hypothetical protein